MIRAMLTVRHPILAKDITAGHIDIVNDQTGSTEASHHDVHLFRRAKDKPEAEPFRSGRLENFERDELSYYDLLHQALNATVEDGFKETAKLQPSLQVAVNQIPGGTGQPKLEGVIHIERLKGGTDNAAKFKIDLFATDEKDGQLKTYRTGQVRNFDVKANGYFDLLRACLNAAVGDGFFRRSKQNGNSGG